jgi:hypothetical protein
MAQWQYAERLDPTNGKVREHLDKLGIKSL